MSTLAGMKRKYGKTVMVKKSRKATSSNQGKFLRNRAMVSGRGPERKVVDTASATYACDTTGSVTFISGCAQGTDFNQCLGRKYNLDTVQLEGIIRPQDANVGATHVRVMLVYDEQPNGAVPAITDILTASTSNAFMNLNNRDRFKVLSDTNVALGAIDNTATQAFAGSPTAEVVNIFRKLNGLPVVRNGAATTAAITNYVTGTLLLVTIGDQAAGVAYDFIGAARCRFYDP